MRYGSVCSGIEAASVAWHPLGWQAAFLSEIEHFPCSVLSHHYPTVPNLGDMTKFKEWDNYAIDVLVGGTPCQSFSVAGLRKGLDDPRGNLMLTYIAIAHRNRPKWVVWENVPGVLSSNGGRDFACLLRGLEECGYGVAYRVLDAQYFGVPQRRRRVFVVGCLGSWQRAAAVLFERHSLQGSATPRRETGEGVAATLKGGSGNRGWNVDDGAPLVARGIEIGPSGGSFTDTNPTLDCRAKDGPIRNQLAGAVLTAFGWQNSANQGDSCSETISPTLDKSKTPAVAYSMITANTGSNGLGVSKEIAPTLDRAQPCAVAAFSAGQSKDAGSIAYQLEQCPTLRGGASGTNQVPTLHAGMQVRRLTPMECERLQGFPDGYTLIPHRGKLAADGPRYKALGNSMAVPVMGWIGRRIADVDSLL